MKKRHCISCGKSGFFLQLNNAMLCKNCESKAQEEQERRAKEEAELKRIQDEKDYNESLAFYRQICNAYLNRPRGFFSDDTPAISITSITNMTIPELQEAQRPYNFLIDNLPKWTDYRFFKDIFMEDFETKPTYYGHCVKHRCFLVERFDDEPPVDIQKEFDKIISYSHKAVDSYNKAIHDIESFSSSILIDDNSVSTNSLCLGWEVHHVAGMKYYEKNLKRIASDNPYYSFTKSVLIDYGLINKEIWKIEFCSCNVELIPEPDNQHDPNAIKVIVNGEHIGYIKANDCIHVLDLINTHRIYSMSCEISGGAYKRVNEHYNIERDKETYYLDRGTKPFEATISMVTIKVK